MLVGSLCYTLLQSMFGRKVILIPDWLIEVNVLGIGMFAFLILSDDYLRRQVL